MESFQEEMSSYQSLTTHITSQSLDRLFTNLALPDFTPDLVEGTSYESSWIFEDFCRAKIDATVHVGTSRVLVHPWNQLMVTVN
jgi:hypothetical protein